MNHLLINNKIDIHDLDKFTAIIGESPSKGARSPKLWNLVLNQSDIRCKMVPIDVDLSNITELLNNLNVDQKFLGGAIAVPYKEIVASWLGNNITTEAKKIGAVNCLYRNSNGDLEGTNTDGEASLSTYVKRFNSIQSKSIMILGLGGAGKAVASYFANSANKMILISRSENDSKYAKKLNASWHNWSEIDNYLKNIDLIINCTSIGYSHQKAKSPLSENQILKLKKSTVIFDIIYQPTQTKLLEISEKNGLSTFNGLEMNLEQAVLAYKYTIDTNRTLSEIRKIMNKKP